LDQQLLFLINREWTSPALDLFMAVVSSFDVWLPLVILLGLGIALRGSFRLRAFLATALLVVAINDGLVSRSLKRLVDRPRPHQSHNDVRQVDLAKAKPRVLAVFKPVKVKMSRNTLQDVDGRSFPSSHTMNTISVALVAGCFFGRRAWWAFLLSALVGYSRIYTGAHWPSDVLTSIFLGLGATMLWLAIFEWLWRTRAAHLLPRLHSAHPSLLAA
jgi:undecaprenyl-diphosphatase